MKRRTVLSGVGALAGVSVSGCLGGNNGNNGGTTSDSPPWLNKVTMDVVEEESKGRLTVHIAKNAEVSEISLYNPDGSLQTTVVVGDNQKRVGLAQVSVSTTPVSFYGMNPGTYQVSALQGGQKTERQSFEVVRDLSVENVSLRYSSSEGKEWVSGFESTVGNSGLYPLILQEFGPTEGVPNPPSEGPGRATPTEEDGSQVIWWRQPSAFYENRGDAPGALVVPEDEGTPDDALVDELTGERTATLAYGTTETTTELSVTYKLEGDLVTTPNGYAMSNGEIVSVEGGSTGTPTETS